MEPRVSDGGTPTSSQKIPFLSKLAFCAPSVGFLPFVAMFSAYGNINYEAFGTPLARISLFTAIARSLDVVSDPLMSYITDTTRSRFGRRRPFLFFGAFPYALFLFLLMRPPYGDADLMSNWFGSMYILYFLSNTCVSIPYFALAPDLSTDSEQRTGLFFAMSIFEAVGTLIAMAAPMAATLGAQGITWNKGWICKPFAERATHCFNSRGCDAVFTEGHDGAFVPNSTLEEVLTPLYSIAAEHLSLPRHVSDCSSYLEEGAAMVLGNLSTTLQNDEFCRCVLTCDQACQVADDRTGFEWVGWLFAVWFLATIMVLVFIIKERPASTRASPPLVPAMLNTMMNGPFRILLPAWACDAFCNAIVQSMTPYFVLIVTAPSHQPECRDRDSPDYNPWFCQTSYVIAACGVFVLIAAIIGLPFWNWLVTKIGKVKTWLAWSIAMAFTNIFFIFLEQGWVSLLWLVAALNGLPLGAKFLADSILVDIIDYDEFLTGERSEATYFMFKGFLPKIVQIVASAVPLALLSVAGYQPPINGVDQLQERPVVIYIKVVVFTCFVVSLIAFFLKRRYPLSTPKHLEELRKGIEAHRQSRSYPDPVTKVGYRLVEVSDELQNCYWQLDHFRAARLRHAFVSGPNHATHDAVELEAAINVHSGALNVVKTMRGQLFCSVACFLASIVATIFGMRLLTVAEWSFVPTLTSVAMGLSLIAMVFASFRLRAAKQLQAAQESGELTAHTVTQVLLRRDLLDRVGHAGGEQSPTAWLARISGRNGTTST